MIPEYGRLHEQILSLKIPLKSICVKSGAVELVFSSEVSIEQRKMAYEMLSKYDPLSKERTIAEAKKIIESNWDSLSDVQKAFAVLLGCDRPVVK